MAGELQFSLSAGKTCYFLIRSRTGTIWNTAGGAFEAYATANYTDYDVSASEQGTASGFYVGTFPTAIPAGIYSVVAKQQLGASPAEGDPTVATGDYHWSGTATVPLSDLTTSGQVGQIGPVKIARGTMVQNFKFKMVSSTDHVTPFVSGVVSGQINRDAGAFGALQSGAFTEEGNGWYRLQALTSGDLLCNTASLLFTAVGISGGQADQRDFSLVLQRVSGQQV